MDMYLIADAERTRVKVEQARYIPGVVLANYNAEEKVISGDGSVVILNFGFRGDVITDYTQFGIGFNENVKHRLYLQLPGQPDTATVELKGRSYLQLLKHYELKPEAKLFLPVSGKCVVDSVSSHDLYGTIDGNFENSEGASVKIDGQFKVKM